MRQVPNKPMASFFLTLLIFSLSILPAFGANKPPSTQTGRLYHYGKIDVLDLHGSYLEMGQQYGRLEKARLQFFYHYLYAQLVIKGHLSFDQLYHNVALRLYREYPLRFQHILQGIARTSGLTLKQTIFINAFEYMLWQLKRQHVSLPGCAFISVNGAYTATGKLILGRNYDYFVGLNPLRALLTVAIFHPNSGDNTVALMSYVGTLNATTLYNSQGLFLELNSGYPSGALLHDHGKTHWDRRYTPIDLFATMLDAPNITSLENTLHSYRSNASFIINVANRNEAASYEWSASAIKKAQTSTLNQGLIVSTNHFVDPRWHIAHQSNLFGTITRRQNLIHNAKKHKGTMTVPVMKKMLMLTRAMGGALDPDTVFQVIMTPENGMLWLRIPNVQDDWTHINLNRFILET